MGEWGCLTVVSVLDLSYLNLLTVVINIVM